MWQKFVCWLLGFDKRLAQADAKIATLKKEVAWKDRVLHRKNVELDALHHVWCSGGCEGGMGRWHDDEVTEEMVRLAEQNTVRMRRHFAARKCRLYRASMNKCAGCSSFEICRQVVVPKS